MSVAGWLTTIPIGICVLVFVATAWRLAFRPVCKGGAAAANGRLMIMLVAVLVGSGLGMARFLVGA